MNIISSVEDQCRVAFEKGEEPRRLYLTKDARRQLEYGFKVSQIKTFRSVFGYELTIKNQSGAVVK